MTLCEKIERGQAGKGKGLVKITILAFSLCVLSSSGIAFGATFQVDNNSSLMTGLVSYYKLDETATGAAAHDSWGSRDLTNASSVAFDSGKLNNAADGGTGNISKYLDYSGDASVGSGAYSISFWMNLTDALSSYPQDSWISLVSAGGGNNDYGVAAINSSNGGGTPHRNLDGFRNYNTGNGNYTAAVDPTLATSTWYHVVYIYDGTKQWLYLNNSVIASGTETTTPNNGNTTGTSMFHGTHTNGMDALYFRGKIDEVGLWNKALTSTEITDLYNSGSADAFLDAAPYIAAGTMQQYQSDSTTTIPFGGKTYETKVVFGATLMSSGKSTVRLDVERATSTANFTGLATASSSLLASGTFATTSISNLALGDYYWRGRAVDSLNNSSTWKDFSATSTADFTVATTSRPSFPFQVDNSSSLMTGLVSYYKLDETATGAGAHDSWGSRDLTNASSVAFGSGKLNNAADGGTGNTSKYFDYTGDVGLGRATSSYSISFWMYFTDALSTYTANTWISTVSVGGSNNDFGVAMNNSTGPAGQSIAVYRNYNVGAGEYKNLWNWNPATSTWYHIVAVYDGSVENLYINGVSRASGTETSAPNNGNTTGTSMFHGTHTNNLEGLYFSGKIDEVGLWNKALSQQEIADLYNASSGDWFSGLNQYKSEDVTTLVRNGTTTESSVVFGSTLYPVGSSTLKLEVEVQPAGTAFTGTPNGSSSFVSSGVNATTTFGTSTLVYPRDPESWSNGSFRWQARVKDINGATSTWQSFGPNAIGNTDFSINTVPLYTQETSTYPSAASTSVWASALYDNGLPGTQCGTGVNSSTIRACGCAITSVVMWLRYFGITTDTLGEDVNPGTLNTWLENNGGYSPTSTGGVLLWPSVEDYASSTSGSIEYDENSANYGASSSKLNSLLSSSTPDPVILFEDNVPDGNATTTHFVVATGFANNAGTSTYTIRDSFWYNTKYLNQATSTGTALTVKGYGNTFSGLHIYYDPPQVPVVNEYIVNSPNTVILVDSQGRRTGKDPTTGVLYREIPDTSYTEEAVNPGHPNGELFTSNLPSGKYTLYILGGKTGFYGLGIAINGRLTQSFSGNIQTSTMFAYAQNYDTTNLASSTFSFESSASSTASITSAPPNNLPPPPVPQPVTPPAPAPAPSPSPSAPSSTLEINPPVISNLTSLVATSSVTISWTTNKLATSDLLFGSSTSMAANVPADTTFTTSHSRYFAGLVPGTLYYYEAQSKDASGNTGSSVQQSFTTLRLTP